MFRVRTNSLQIGAGFDDDHAAIVEDIACKLSHSGTIALC